MSLLDLLQLADSSFPAGGFAFSNGLESLAKSGYVKTWEDFREYLGCHLEQMIAAEMPFLASAFAAALPPGGSRSDDGPAGEAAAPDDAAPEEFAAVAREWDAWVFLPAPRRASLSQGQAWTRALEAAWGISAVTSIRPWFSARGLPLHFLMAFAAGLRVAGYGFGEAQSLLLHMTLRDQLGAAVRLGLIGSLQAQRLHREHIAEGESLLSARAGRIAAGHAAAERTAPMIELAQASHPNLYSKLFQS
jgi:urease accessory protein